MDSESPKSRGFDRLQQAMDLYLGWESAAEREPFDRFLTRHEDLRDLLEPMHDDADGSADAAPTRRLGGYELGRELGRGGMGVVFEARDPALGRRVALKVLTDHVTRDPATVARFRREAALAARLDHRAIVGVLGFGEEAGTHFLAMELVDGASLDRVLARVRDARCRGLEANFAQALAAAAEDVAIAAPSVRAPTDPRPWFVTIATLFAELADALAHAHAHGIVHRDVKPGNVLVRGDGRVALADFGLAKEADRPSMTRTGTFAGTPQYMAPEQIAGRPGAIDARTDVFSLGATLYEALTLRLPFEGESAQAVLQAVLDRDPIDPQRVDPRVPTDLAAIVSQCLDKDPARRYPSAAALRDDLRAFLEYRPVAARRTGAIQRLGRFVRRRPLVAGLGALATTAILVGTTVAWVLWLSAAEQARLVQRKVDEFRLLSNVVRLDEARASERTLYPPWPERAAAMERWLAEDWARVERALPEVVAMRDELDARLAAVPPERRDPTQDAESILVTMLDQLVTDAEAFGVDEVAAVRERLAWSRRVAELSIERYADRWAAVREDLPDLPPQMGLVPIGKNPATGLHEFYHLRSAADPERIPEHDPDGHLDVDAFTGIVFVLVPGGRFRVGCQADDPDAPYYDPYSPDPDPVHELALDDYFIARHEITQGQWSRLAPGEQPSYYLAGNEYGANGFVGGDHPVEQVDWTTCDRTLRAFGLDLPTEAQWEVACRAGTTTTWWTGKDLESLRAGGPAENFADATAARTGALQAEASVWPGYDDGAAIHMPVDALRANPWGLHHTLGNVWEWCRDPAHLYENSRPRPGDGLRVPLDGVPPSRERIVRGGGYAQPPTVARCAARDGMIPDLRADIVGVRAARRVYRDR